MVPLTAMEKRGSALREFDPGARRAEHDAAPGQKPRSEVVEERPTVFVVDDDAETRDVLRGLAASAGFATEVYADARTFLKQFEPGHVGCLVLDAQLSDMTGPEVQKELARRKLSIPIIVTMGYANLRMAIEAIRAGALDVIEKPLVSERLVDSIRQAIAQSLEARKKQTESHEIRCRYAGLTARQRQVLELVVTGMTSKVIAEKLGLQQKTIEVYRSRINNAMEARNAADLVRLMTCIP